MKGTISALLSLSLLLAAVMASAQFVKSKDLEKLKKRTKIIIVKEVPDKSILKQLRRANSAMAEDYKQAIKQLNMDFPEVVRQFFVVDGVTFSIEQRTEKEVEKLRKKGDRNYVVMDCQSLHVKPAKSHYAKAAQTYTASLAWKSDAKDLSVPVINMYFIENDVQKPFYIQNMSERFPDYLDLAVGIRLATYVFSDHVDDKTARVMMQSESKHNAIFLKDRTLLLCKNWLDDDFERAKAGADYPYPIKYVDYEELESLFRKDGFAGTVMAYVPAGVFSTFDKNTPSMEVHVPVVIDPINGMPLCHTDISDEMFQAWGYSLIPKMGKSIVGFRKIRNEDIKNFAKSMKE
jgi:hypothetical protein